MLAVSCLRGRGQSYSAPAGIRPAQQHMGASILPGGRVIQPLGQTYITGSGPFGLALSASGKTLLTSNTGPGRNSLTLLELEKSSQWTVRHLLAHTREDDRNGSDRDESSGFGWRGAFMGIAFASEHSAFVSEGDSGKVSLFDFNSDRRRTVDLNQQVQDSYTGDLALDSERKF